jgi:hypothetical protein
MLIQCKSNPTLESGHPLQHISYLLFGSGYDPIGLLPR